LVDDVLIAEREADDPLADQGAQRMDHPARIAAVSEARHPIRPTALSVSRSSNARDSTSPPLSSTPLRPGGNQTSETQLLRDTLCRHRTTHSDLTSALVQTTSQLSLIMSVKVVENLFV
jgi:hypothetical protein